MHENLNLSGMSFLTIVTFLSLLLWECSSRDLQNAALLLLRYACDASQKKKQKCRNDGKINSNGRLNLRDNSSEAHCTPAKDTSPLVSRSDWGFTAWVSRQPQCNQRRERRQGELSQFAVCQVSPEADMVSGNDYTDSITLKSASQIGSQWQGSNLLPMFNHMNSSSLFPTLKLGLAVKDKVN